MHLLKKENQHSMENKIIKNLSFVVISICFITMGYAQGNRQIAKKLEIDPILIDYVELIQIKANKKLSKPKRINKGLIQKFVKSWNAEHPIIPCTKEYSFVLAIYYKDLTKKDYFINKSTVSDNKSYCIDIGSKTLVDEIWKNK